jgi:hypothetical protein
VLLHDHYYLSLQPSGRTANTHPPYLVADTQSPFAVSNMPQGATTKVPIHLSHIIPCVETLSIPSPTPEERQP